MAGKKTHLMDDGSIMLDKMMPAKKKPTQKKSPPKPKKRIAKKY